MYNSAIINAPVLDILRGTADWIVGDEINQANDDFLVEANRNSTSELRYQIVIR